MLVNYFYVRDYIYVYNFNRKFKKIYNTDTTPYVRLLWPILLPYVLMKFWGQLPEDSEMIVPKHDICRFVHHSKIHKEKSNKMQQCIKICIIPYLYKAQHVSGDTPPIIRSLKLHWQPLVFHSGRLLDV
jgi:hypothetical protein